MVAQETVESTSMVVIIILIVIGFYVLASWLLYRIGRKLGYQSSWYAWIPILNLYMMVDLSYRPTLKWFLLIIILGIIPLINLIALVMEILVIMDICNRCGKGGWWVILWMLPIVNFIAMFILGSGEAPRLAASKGTWSPDDHPAFRGYPPTQPSLRRGEMPYKPGDPGKRPPSSSWK